MNTRGAVQEYLARFFNGLFREVEGTVSVGTVPTLLCQENPERVGLALVNYGAAPVIVAPSPTVTVNAGLFLIDGGGSVTMNIFQDSSLPSRAWYGISLVAGQTVYVLQEARDVMIASEAARPANS